MPDPEMTRQDLLNILVPEIRAARDAAQTASEQICRLDERMTQVMDTTRRLEKSIYGNGEPGLRQYANDHEKRLKELEEIHRGEKASRLFERLEKIEEHVSREIEDKKANLSEWRKLRWGVLGTIIATMINLLVHFLGSPK